MYTAMEMEATAESLKAKLKMSTSNTNNATAGNVGAVFNKLMNGRNPSVNNLFNYQQSSTSSNSLLPVPLTASTQQNNSTNGKEQPFIFLVIKGFT